MDIQAVSGIGPQYEAKLASADVTDLESLAAMDPATVAERTGFSEERLSAWRDEARQLLGGGGDPPSGAQAAGRDHKFVLTLTVSGDGTVQRSTVEDARTREKVPMAGWSVDRFVEFVTSRAGIEPTATAEAVAAESPGRTARLDDLDRPCHLLGGHPTALELEVGTDRLAEEEVHDVRYVISATAHELGNPTHWRSLGVYRGAAEAGQPIRLHVDAPDLDPGVHRVELQVAADPAEAAELLELRTANVAEPV